MNKMQRAIFSTEFLGAAAVATHTQPAQVCSRPRQGGGSKGRFVGPWVFISVTPQWGQH